jgi:hypothetical protein
MSQPGSVITQNLNPEPFDYDDIHALMNEENTLSSISASTSTAAMPIPTAAPMPMPAIILPETASTITTTAASKTYRDTLSPQNSIEHSEEDLQILDQYITRIKKIHSSASQSTPIHFPGPSPTHYDGTPIDWNRNTTPIDKEAAEKNHQMMLNFIQSHPDWFAKFSKKSSDSEAEVQNRISALIRCYCLKDMDSFEKIGGQFDEYELCASIDTQAKSNAKKTKTVAPITPAPPTLTSYCDLEGASSSNAPTEFITEAKPFGLSPSASSGTLTPTHGANLISGLIQVSPIKASSPTKISTPIKATTPIRVSTPKTDNTDLLQNHAFSLFKDLRGDSHSISPLPPSDADKAKPTANSPSKGHTPTSAFVVK